MYYNKARIENLLTEGKVVEEVMFVGMVAVELVVVEMVVSQMVYKVSISQSFDSHFLDRD